MLQEGIYTIKARSNGKYVCRDVSNVAYAANRDVASTWERFHLHKRDDQWAIQDWKGAWWARSSHSLNTQPVPNPRWSYFMAWHQEGIDSGTTRWDIEHVGGDDYAFRALQYVTAEPSGIMNADRNERSTWETFTLTRVGGPEQLFADEGTVYRIDGNGALVCFKHDRNGGFYAGQGIGTGWGDLRFVSAVRGGHLYAVDGSGNLLYYRHEGGNWPVAARVIGTGWNHAWVGATRFGDLYVITREGALLFYRHDDAFQFQIAARQIGTAWGGLRVFGGGTNALYAINSNQQLLYYYHDDALRWRHEAMVIGWAWGDIAAASSAGNGEIYAVTRRGDLLFYRHDVDKHFIGGSGKKIGEGWGGRADQAVIAAAR